MKITLDSEHYITTYDNSIDKDLLMLVKQCKGHTCKFILTTLGAQIHIANRNHTPNKEILNKIKFIIPAFMDNSPRTGRWLYKSDL